MPGVSFYNLPAVQDIDIDFQAILDRGSTLGYSLPTGTAFTAGNLLIKELKTAGIWNKLDIFYVFATNGDSDFATLNWKTPASFQATKVNSPTFTSLEGFTGNGSSSYLDTNFHIRNEGVVAANMSVGGYIRTIKANGGGIDPIVGADSGPSDILISATSQFLNSIFYRINDEVNAITANITAGLHHGDRSSTSSRSAFINGVQLVSIGNVTNTPNVNLSVLRFASIYSNSQVSIAFLGESLSTEASDFYTAIQTYMTAIGKQV